jgi:hypothetical protein
VKEVKHSSSCQQACYNIKLLSSRAAGGAALGHPVAAQQFSSLLTTFLNVGLQDNTQQ